jgi:hypothetical protein
LDETNTLISGTLQFGRVVTIRGCFIDKKDIMQTLKARQDQVNSRSMGINDWLTEIVQVANKRTRNSGVGDS